MGSVLVPEVEMSVVKERERLAPSSSDRITQHRSPRQAVPLGVVCVAATLSAFACSLTTNLDFVGDGGKKPSATGGSSSTTSASDGGTSSSSSALGGSAGVSGASGVAGAGIAGANDLAGGGMAGASGGSAKEPDTCDDSCADHGVCSEDGCLCPGGTPACEGSCANAIETAGYCGRCGKVCRSDENCVGGVCSCLEAGQTSCSSGCVDLSSNLAHCGRCDNACSKGQLCIEGACRASPCDGLCAAPQSMAEAADGFRASNLGSNERCFAVSGYEPTETEARIVCWNFDSERTLRVNGKVVACVSSQGISLRRQTSGWYCIQASAGGWEYAGLLLPKF